MARSLRLVELRIPLHDRFAASAGAISVRRVVLVGLSEDDLCGWGEAAPYSGLTPETTGDVWDALAAAGPSSLRSGVSRPLPPSLPRTARAAFEQAGADLAARIAGRPLWSQVGGSGRPSLACAAIGLQESPEGLLRSVERVVRAGARQVKLKIEPGRDLDYLRATRRRFPSLSVAADANGSYPDVDSVPASLDSLGLAYVEQPLPAPDLAGHADLRRRWSTPVCLDESAHSPIMLERILHLAPADLVSLKPGLLGPAAVRAATDRAEAAGMGVKIGGLVETSVGRAHALALASRPSVSAVDLAPPLWLLTADPSPQNWDLIDGYLFPLDKRGLEVNLDRRPISDHVVRATELAP